TVTPSQVSGGGGLDGLDAEVDAEVDAEMDAEVDEGMDTTSTGFRSTEVCGTSGGCDAAFGSVTDGVAPEPLGFVSGSFWRASGNVDESLGALSAA
ncbi:MAG TPA: hypothetical protein VIM14_13090, partial [Polyangia bacterium]